MLFLKIKNSLQQGPRRRCSQRILDAETRLGEVVRGANTLCPSINGRPAITRSPLAISPPGGLQIGDFRPLLQLWDYEIRDQRPLITIIPNGEGLG